MCSVRSVTNPRTINSILIQLQIKFRPTSQIGLRTNTICIFTHLHRFNAHIHRSFHVRILPGMHQFEWRHVYQRLFGEPRFNHLFYQSLLKADRQEVRCEIRWKETSVRHRINADFLTSVIKEFRREWTGTIFPDEWLHQLIITWSQTAIQHLVQWCIRLMKTDKHFVHLLTKSVRSILKQGMQIVFQINKKFGSIKEVIIFAATQLVDVIHQFCHTVCFQHSYCALRH